MVPIMATFAGANDPISNAKVVAPPAPVALIVTWTGQGLDQPANSFPSQSFANLVRWASAASSMRWQFSGVVPLTSKFFNLGSGAGATRTGSAAVQGVNPPALNPIIAANVTAIFTCLKIIRFWTPV